jgi:CBS domain-containing protein
MKTVKDILQAKGQEVWSVRPDATMLETLQLMAEKNVGAMLVKEGENLVGIVSERDYARKVTLRGKTSRETRVHEIMTPDTICVDPELDVETCMELMTVKHVRHLPVVKEDRVIGVISIGDIVKTIISNKEFLIEQLEKYIKGHR